jgi:hypothetical protein
MDAFQRKFTANLTEAKRAELAAIELLKKRGSDAFLNPATDLAGLRKGDIIVKGQSGLFYIEVKTDFISAYSGNIALEHDSLWKSGSDWFLYALPTFYAAPLPQLKQLAKDENIVQGGDFYRAITLVPKDKFISLPFVTKL